MTHEKDGHTGDSGVAPGRNPGDIAVVGGSAAGLYAAALLARGGASVQVLEGLDSLEPAARTLIVTHRLREMLGAAAQRSERNPALRAFHRWPQRHGCLEKSGSDRGTTRPDPDSGGMRAGGRSEDRAGPAFSGAARERERAGGGGRTQCGWSSRGSSRGHGDWRRRRDQPRGARRGMGAAGNRAADAGHRAAAERHGRRYRARVVHTAGHSLFLLAHSGIERTRRARRDRGKRSANAAAPGAIHGEARLRADGVSGGARAGVYELDSDSPAGGARLGVFGRRRGGAGKGLDRGWNGHRISRRARRGTSDSERRKKHGAGKFAP